MSSLRGIDWVNLTITILIAAGVYFRIFLYGDLFLSVSTNDTISYIRSSQSPWLSLNMLTGERLLSTNIIYKIFNSLEGYEITVNGTGNTTHREYQPGLKNIAYMQSIVAMVAWVYLAHVLSRHIRTKPLRILCVLFLLGFAFTPPIADWDSVLMSESLTFSLFALQFGLIANFLFTIQMNPERKFWPDLTVFLVVHVFWVFLRDAHLYSEVVFIIFLMVLIRYPIGKTRKWVIPTLLLSLVTLLVGGVTSSISPRGRTVVSNVYNSDLLPFPARVEFLLSQGMPENTNSKEYEIWFENHAIPVFAKFMISHPGYVAYKFSRDFIWSFSETTQTHFRIPGKTTTRQGSLAIGDMHHPRSATPFLIDLIILFALAKFAHRNASTSSRIWAWLAGWVFFSALIIIFSSIMGDVYALNRHTLFSTMVFRLVMWVFTLVMVDLGLTSQGN